MHKLLKRQLKKSRLENSEIDHAQFSKLVDQAYHDHDDSIRLMESTNRSLESEVMDLNDKMREKMTEAIQGRNQIKRIFDNIHQGIVTFDETLKIDIDYSKYMENLLETPSIAGESIDTLIFSKLVISKEKYDILYHTVKAIVGENELSWHLNFHNLQKDFFLLINGRKKCISLDWTPILNHNQYVEKIMMTIRDLTVEMELQHSLAEEKNKKNQFTNIIRALFEVDRSRVYGFISQASNEIKELKDLLSPKTLGDSKTLMILHTIKGNARIFRFEDLADLTHKAESLAKAERFDFQLEELADALERINLYLSECRHVIESFFKSKKELTPINFNLYYLCSQIMNSLPGKMLKHNMKMPHFVVRDSVIFWRSEIIEKINGILVHAINNSLFHGFINPKMKSWHIDDDPSISVISSALDDEFIVLDISDNGYGIDKEAIAAKLNVGEQDLTSQQIHDFIFKSSSSTSLVVSKDAGRGVGMNVVMQFAADLGGRVEFDYERKEGCKLRFFLARSVCMHDMNTSLLVNM